ncbi:hypothetical protein LguiB_004953 [Lonicera macranthoides]
MNTTLRATDGLQATSIFPHTLHVPSSSFSSFSSSNLDTESTASFFQDNSVSLGRLIGIKPGDRGSLYFPNTVCLQRHEDVSELQSLSHEREMEMSSGICVPQLLNIMVKRSRSKSCQTRS